MGARFRHISINADDVERDRRFYESVCGWRFQPWGPPDFYLLADAGIGGGLQARREIAPGARMVGVEATVAVDDLHAARAAIEAGGGRIVSGPFHIETVGALIWFEDTEGNLCGAMRYDAADPIPPDAAAPAVVRQVALNADDVERAKGFYARVFGWAFSAGAGGSRVTRDSGMACVLLPRRELKSGARMIGFEACLAVADIEAFAAAVAAHGGQWLTAPAGDPAGAAAYFADASGNLLGVCGAGGQGA
jgi:predicted enzyme related to lactoylglutathione lyase